ncbi:hypothetical protein TEA_004509 [Camellia sinensis var. sinensis]|uniref:SH3 domain-containing protein n=1 Tax=Camellia sinensis var. sinensis TaxID=542762 RepID=A0A4S4EAJ3_CAMSN|nr:hypothetical protein TEA_004509 [Camellia sinensis var. sinensis]
MHYVAQHFQKDIVRGVQGFISTGKKQMEITRKLAEDCYKHGTENQSAGSPLATAAFQFGASHGSMENERETMLGILGSQVGAEKSYHQNIIATLDELHAEIILEKQLNESSSQSVTMQRDADVPPVLDDTISDGPDVPQDEHQNDSYFIAKVIHSFDAQAKGELSLLVDDYVVVRQASLVTTASLHLYAIVVALYLG